MSDNINKKVMIVYIDANNRMYIDLSAKEELGLSFNSTETTNNKRIEITKDTLDNLMNFEGIEIKKVFLDNKKLPMTIYKDENDNYYLLNFVVKTALHKDVGHGYDYYGPLTNEEYTKICEQYNVTIKDILPDLEEKPYKKAM